ncbi:hypothetical protein [Brackiella oedipodis]|uniref:hypothetical protein n=1 Tax=Brackiella oedipodis TaxID=124225 RepID=UPI00048FFC5E|nr:hypothetical protein [Brackiella oedipodis]
MFRSRKNVFKPSVYGSSTRPRRGLPRWVVILFTGIIIGAVGYWFVRTNYGPPTISVQESRELNDEVNSLSQERQSLKAQVDDLQQKLGANEGQQNSITNQLAQKDEKIKQLQTKLDMVMQAIPADPSGAPASVRGAELKGIMGHLDYQFLVMKKNADAPDINAVIEIEIQGRYKNGRLGYAHLQAIDTVVGNFTQVKGGQDLEHDTLTPTKASVRLRDKDSRKILSQASYTVEKAAVPEPLQ